MSSGACGAFVHSFEDEFMGMFRVCSFWGNVQQFFMPMCNVGNSCSREYSVFSSKAIKFQFLGVPGRQTIG